MEFYDPALKHDDTSFYIISVLSIHITERWSREREREKMHVPSWEDQGLRKLFISLLKVF